ncbi:nitroreductase family protein [Acinetobacter cumulans]|uniref:nitroreductase family protein n=1 Tax=Acinetobacter cumulans TaxID=2136182 RepID=UPI00148C90FA|nr:nitroreductase family protein [Acinetobacter cumulans]
MQKIKKVLILLGLKAPVKWLRDFYLLLINYIVDANNYYKYSSVFKKNDSKKKESDMIMAYHSIEKGFLHENIKYGFARDKVKIIIEILTGFFNTGVELNSQSISAINVLIEYYDFHKNKKIDISDFFPDDFYEKILKNKKIGFSPVQKTNIKNFFEKNNDNFKDFAFSRKSLRDFTGEKVDIGEIENIISLANTTPSVCNRQSCKVYLMENKVEILKVLKIQDGFKGYEKNVSQVLILTANKNYFFSIGERNQMYIDGGIYLMNLLYSLHYYKVAACPANWGKCISDDKKIRKYINIPMNEQIICVIPIGKAQNEIVYANSERRTIAETLVVSSNIV